MPGIDVCIETMFNDLPLVERAKRVWGAGFDAILHRTDQMGYKGLFGLEYWPALDPDESLRRIGKLTADVRR